ncbi:hypothetical protein F0U59_51865 [Archangium gephyra]|nr:hypothetical protein F0U59_51865 [Archangium gephyra]
MLPASMCRHWTCSPGRLVRHGKCWRTQSEECADSVERTPSAKNIWKPSRTRRRSPACHRPLLDIASLPEHVDIFRLADAPALLIANERLVDAVRRLELNGVFEDWRFADRLITTVPPGEQ